MREHLSPADAFCVLPEGVLTLIVLFNPATLSMLVPIIVLVGWILARLMKHRERMAMIEKGMNPDTTRDRGNEQPR